MKRNLSVLLLLLGLAEISKTVSIENQTEQLNHMCPPKSDSKIKPEHGQGAPEIAKAAKL
jgi:hypothetical protein